MAHANQAQHYAKQLAKLSLADNESVDAERVAGVLAYLEKHPPARPLAVLKAYQSYITQALARTNAVVEHAGAISDVTLGAVAGALSQKYKRAISATGVRNDDLLAGLRVRIGDDVYESSVAGQLAALESSL